MLLFISTKFSPVNNFWVNIKGNSYIDGRFHYLRVLLSMVNSCNVMVSNRYKIGKSEQR